MFDPLAYSASANDQSPHDFDRIAGPWMGRHVPQKVETPMKSNQLPHRALDAETVDVEIDASLLSEIEATAEALGVTALALIAEGASLLLRRREPQQPLSAPGG